MSNWEREYITKWNCYRFPMNTRYKQMRKVESEIDEWKNALDKSHKLEELADVYISSAGLARFTTIGELICRLFEALPEFYDLKRVIDAKMEVNDKRRFDKKMHHIELEEKEEEKRVHPGVSQPEYITVQRTMNVWKKDDAGNWVCIQEPFEYQELKKAGY